ncbi:MAG: histidinol-phosphate aminotransferase family protein [Fischerella sp.]|jgi:histidinol-phosphate aminotransferase|uniref:pyridoxal phosphate-dependent aminotransferase n=1 Tax=Fischerella sp. TaxID=1191 RepID=UPI0017DBD586|nr:histidinol-phosphate transaminase [Fischerella sp.]NWF57803.1 histidinol-phosphate aminotransferase family protein [Fischerella sp.]
MKPNIETMIRLDLNENPYPLPACVKEAIYSAVDDCSRYPFGLEDGVIQKIASKFSVADSTVLLTQGIDEAIDRLIQQFREMRFVIFNPTFDAYIWRVKVNHQDHCLMSLDDSFRINESSINCITPNDFVILANPNNPTGHIFEDDAIQKVMQRCGKLLIDEAYIDFSDRESWVSRRLENMFVFRSFSKAFGLAGLRLGFVVGDANAVSEMRARQWCCNISSMSIEVLNQALEDDYYKINAAKVIQERERMVAAIAELGFDVVPTHTNFFLVKDDSNQLMRYLQNKQLRVKDAALFGMYGYLRISLGNYESNNQLLTALKEFKFSHV